MKNKWLAAGLNIFPGLGYLYAGIRTPFALLLLLAIPLYIVSIFMTPQADIDAMSTVPYRIWDFLPQISMGIGFIVDVFIEVQNQNRLMKKNK